MPGLPPAVAAAGICTVVRLTVPILPELELVHCRGLIMPVKVTKTPRGYRVSTPGGVKSKGTTKAKALSQERLLNAVEHDPNFKPRKKK